jgi:hypothetical protein
MIKTRFGLESLHLAVRCTTGRHNHAASAFG